MRELFRDRVKFLAALKALAMRYVHVIKLNYYISRYCILLWSRRKMQPCKGNNENSFYFELFKTTIFAGTSCKN